MRQKYFITSKKVRGSYRFYFNGKDVTGLWMWYFAGLTHEQEDRCVPLFKRWYARK